MDLTFDFFTDAALTTRVIGRIPFMQTVNAPGYQDAVLYFGSPNAARLAFAAPTPGTTHLSLAVIDEAAGTGSPAADVKLALSEGGLAAAAGGAALDLGVTVLGGYAHAVAIHIRVLDSSHQLGLHDDLRLVMNTVVEYE